MSRIRTATAARIVAGLGSVAAGAAVVLAMVAPGVEARAPLPPASVHAPATSASAGGARSLRPLHDFEEQRRKQTNFQALPTGDRVTGPDPYVIRALPGGARFVSILRGAGALVLLDGELRVVDRAETPRAPTGLAVSEAGDIYVSSELTPEIVRFRVAGRSLQRDGSLTLSGVRAIRDLAIAPNGLLYALDEVFGRVITLRLGPSVPGAGGGMAVVARSEKTVGRGPITLQRVGPLLLINCLLDHAVVVWRVDQVGQPTTELARVTHDGPIWSFDAVVDAAATHATLVVGGVEDHPLDRTGGSFGYIDSFLTVYRIAIAGGAAAPERLAAVNLSAHGVVTPKVIVVAQGTGTDASGGLGVMVSGYGTTPLITLTWPKGLAAAPVVKTAALAPGTTSVARRNDGALVFADPLLDAWLVHSSGKTQTTPVPPLARAAADSGDNAAERDALSRVGEALLFTTLMAPWNRSDGALSRFTCETCHFEMYVDGRTHHTGRGDVRATTKPLRGLFNNRPHFSRALDPDLATVADNEFRVAGANSGHDPWFTVKVADVPWLRTLGVKDRTLTPLVLRKALMTSLMELGHIPNPAVRPGTSWTDAQRAGAALFRDRCEGCHQGRLVSDDPATRAPFADWERLILTEADPLVWGQAEYRQTGVIPYVHESGARVPSLRRLYKKAPYFTNGSAPDLGDLLTRARWSDDTFFHQASPGSPALQQFSPDAVQRLRAFLDLL